MNRTAFTLIELLAVLAIIVLLLGLLFPMLQTQRVPSSLAICLNNQKNIALAFANYDSSKNALPGWRQKLENGRTVGWTVVLFPYIEEPWLYDTWSASTDDPETLPMPIADWPNYRISVLQCPAAKPQGAAINCVVNAGMQDLGRDDAGAFVRKPDTRLWSGVFFDRLDPAAPTINLDFISVNRGTSDTILLTENLQAGTWLDTSESAIGFVYPAWESVFDRSALPNRRACDPKSLPKLPDPQALWAPLLANRCRDGKAISGNVGDFADYRYARPASNHSGIFIAAFCDASARRLDETIDPAVLEQMMQPALPEQSPSEQSP